MFTHLLAIVAGVIIASIPSLLDSSSPTPSRNSSPRPQLNFSLLAVDSPEDESVSCQGDSYGSRILSTEPLVIYLEGFLSEEERKHLLEISNPLFEPATITNDATTTSRNTTVRDSQVALIPRTPAVRCIERRALALQAWRRDVFVERLRTQRYVQAGHYRHHFDWSRNVGGWGRVSSMMVWVDDGALSGDGVKKEDNDDYENESGQEGRDELKGGGTEFPRLTVRGRQDGGQLCEMIECDERNKGEKENTSDDNGTTFKVKPGNAVYWENFRADGKGFEETWHAGLPVQRGVKVGLNIWSFGRIE